MPLAGHLGELRVKCVAVLIPFLILFMIALAFSDVLLYFVFYELRMLGGVFYAFGIADGVLLRVRAAVLAALTVVAPWGMCQLGAFAKPGLTPREYVILVRASFIGGAMFTFGGVAFALWLAPVVSRWWYASSDAANVRIDASVFLSMWETGLLLCGAVSALPVALALYCRHRRSSWIAKGESR